MSLPFYLSLCLFFLHSSHSLAADMCYFEGGRTIISNNGLYWMGGTYSFAGTNDTIAGEESIYWIELNSTFPVDGVVKDDFLHSTSSNPTQYTGGGAFFTDKHSTMLYSIGGYPDDSLDGIPSLNAFDTRDDSWSAPGVSGGPFNKLNRAQAMYATTETGGQSLGFIAGGQDYCPGLLSFNASNPQELSWQNTTEDVPYFWGPTTQYVRFGDKGVLVSLGGYSDTFSTPRDMSAIQIYDIHSQTWFEVTAGGDIPGPRSEFCSALSASPDDSSFQMTIYAGWSQVENYGLEDVYVLTMPAFEWIKINDTGNREAQLFGQTGRRRQFCNAYQDRQMIVLGGAVLNGSHAVNLTLCDPQYPAIKLLDLTTFEWQTQYPIPNTTYQVPSPVYNVIGGGPEGRATATAPSGGFTDPPGGPSLSQIFSKRVDPNNNLPQDSTSTSSTTNNPASSTAKPTNTNTPPAKSSTLSTKAIIAIGVVSGIAFLALLSTISFLLLRTRNKNKRKNEDLHNPQSVYHKPELPTTTSSSSPPIRDFQRHEIPGGHKMVDLRPEMAGETVRGREMDGETVRRREMDAWVYVEAPERELAHEMPGSVGYVGR